MQLKHNQTQPVSATKKKNFAPAKLAVNASMLFNGISTLANLYNLLFKRVGHAESGFSSLANKLGTLATKTFYVVNSIVNLSSRLKVKDYLAGAGHGLDVLLSLITKQSDLFISRGLSVGLYMFGNGVKDALQKYKFSSFSEHLSDIKQAISMGLNSSKSNFWQNFKSSKTGTSIYDCRSVPSSRTNSLETYRLKATRCLN